MRHFPGSCRTGSCLRPPSIAPLTIPAADSQPRSKVTKTKRAIRDKVELLSFLLAAAEPEGAGLDLAPLAAGLRRLAEGYEYDRLIQLLGGEPPEGRP